MTFHSQLPEIAAHLVQGADAAVRAGADEVAREAKQRVRVHSGRLRDSIHVDRVDGSKYAVVAGGPGVFYGALVEFGGAHTPARPFLVPALHDARDGVVRRVRDAIQP